MVELSANQEGFAPTEREAWRAEVDHNHEVIDTLALEAVHLRDEVSRLRAALTQIENWVGKEYHDLAEAEQIRDFIDKACEEGLGSR